LKGIKINMLKVLKVIAMNMFHMKNAHPVGLIFRTKDLMWMKIQIPESEQ
jgi:hypothetical protein